MLPLALTHKTDEADETMLDYGINDALNKTEEQQEQREKERRERDEILHDNLEETAPITISNGLVTFCHHFKYLGSYVSFCLCHDYDIDKRIAPPHPNPWAL
jgi:hypothetical protein